MQRSSFFVFLVISMFHILIAQPIKRINVEVNNIDKLKDFYFNEPNRILSINDNFYILDKNSEIYKFDNNWKYLKKIGRKGKGPGEFIDISLFECINGRILIFDRGLRRFSLVEKENDMIKEFIYEKQYNLEPYKIFDVNNGYLIYNLNVGGYNNATLQFVEYSGKKIVNISSLSEMMELKDKFSYTLFNKPSVYINEISKGNSFFISPYIYNNCIVYLKWANKKWDWKKVEGKKLKNPFERRNLSDLQELKKGEKPFKLMSSGRDKYLISKNSICNGVYVYKNRFVFQFVTDIREIKNLITFINVFSIEGTYINSFDVANDALSNSSIIGYDNEAFYISCSDEDGIPSIKKVTLVVE